MEPVRSSLVLALKVSSMYTTNFVLIGAPQMVTHPDGGIYSQVTAKVFSDGGVTSIWRQPFNLSVYSWS